MIPGPRVLAATRALVATGSYGPAGFDPRWEIPKGAQVVDGPVEMRKAVREQIAAGADWIKVYADYRRRPGRHDPHLHPGGDGRRRGRGAERRACPSPPTPTPRRGSAVPSLPGLRRSSTARG